MTPTFPLRGVEIIDALVERHPVLAHGDDEQRRWLTRLIAEQLSFEAPDRGWGTKRSGPGRPLSKDAIAQQQTDGRLYAWDWQHGGTRARQVQAGDEGTDITGQVFEAVMPVDHLGTGGAAPPDLPPDPPPDEDSQSTAVLLLEALAALAAIRQDTGEIRARQDRAMRLEQNIEGTIGPFPVRGTVTGRAIPEEEES